MAHAIWHATRRTERAIVARAIVDTGYVVALLNAADDDHAWAAGLVPSLRGPWVTAEACVSEAVFLLERVGRAAEGTDRVDARTYMDYFAGRLRDYEYPDREVAMALAGLPSVAGA